MRRDEPFAIVPDERQTIGALLAGQVDFSDSEEEDRVEAIRIANVDFLVGGNAGARRPASLLQIVAA